VLPGVTVQTSRHQIAKAVVATFCNGCDVIQSGGESGKLLLAIAAFVSVPLVYFDAVLANTVKVDIGVGNLSLRFRRRSFLAKFPTRMISRNFSSDIAFSTAVEYDDFTTTPRRNPLPSLTRGLPSLATECRKAYQ